MKRIFFFLITFFWTIIIYAQNGVRYTATNLNMRAGAGESYLVIDVVPAGTKVSIDETCNCQWVLIEYNGKVGYISTKYLVKQSSKNKYYTNSEGIRVQSPTYYNSVPAGATALSRDGTYSFSRNRRGTCSHHGGVKKWLK